MDPFEEFEKMFKDLFRSMGGGGRVEIFTPFQRSGLDLSKGYREPLVDIREEKKHIVVTAEVPGVDKKDIHLEINDAQHGRQTLVITAEREERDVKKKEHMESSSSMSMSFRKEVLLPDRVKKKTAEAKYRNGILEVRLERTEPKKKEKFDIPVK